MKTVLIVCGAGASSTFLAQRIRTAAKAVAATAASGNPVESEITVIASSLSGLSSLLSSADVLLVGPHLADAFPGILAEATLVGVTALLLPATIFGADGGERALALVSHSDLHQPLHP
jgi:PTS system cellobiose-specific IIB component